MGARCFNNLPNLFVFADELGGLFADSTIPGQKQRTFSRAEKYDKEEEAIIGVGLSTHPLVAIGQTSPYEIQPISQLIRRAGTFSLRYKAFEPFEPSQVISWLLQVSDTKKKNWM